MVHMGSAAVSAAMCNPRYPGGRGRPAARQATIIPCRHLDSLGQPLTPVSRQAALVWSKGNGEFESECFSEALEERRVGMVPIADVPAEQPETRWLEAKQRDTKRTARAWGGLR